MMKWCTQKTRRKLARVNILVSLYPLNKMLNRLQSKDIYASCTFARPAPQLSVYSFAMSGRN